MEFINPYTITTLDRTVEFPTEQLCHCYFTQEWVNQKDTFKKALMSSWEIKSPEGTKICPKILFTIPEEYQFKWRIAKSSAWRSAPFKRQWNYAEDTIDVFYLHRTSSNYYYLFTISAFMVKNHVRLKVMKPFRLYLKAVGDKVEVYKPIRGGRQ